MAERRARQAPLQRAALKALKHLEVPPPLQEWKKPTPLGTVSIGEKKQHYDYFVRVELAFPQNSREFDEIKTRVLSDFHVQRALNLPTANEFVFEGMM